MLQETNRINLMTNSHIRFTFSKAAIKNFLAKYKFLILLLFVAFFSYRLYFWGDLKKHGLHCFLNALSDTFVAVLAGNALLIIRKSLLTRKRTRYFLTFTLAFLFTLLLFFLHYLVYKFFGILNSDFIHFFKAICFQLLDSFSMVGSGMMSILLLHLQREKHILEMNYAHLENSRLHTELKYLKAQMDPHFLFNALNTIYYQIPIYNNEAKNSVIQFSDILRYHIYKANKDKVFLSEEIQYLNAYLDFQELRNTEHLQVKRNINILKNNLKVEPLLLFPLVENAFKHVKTTRQKKGFIEITAYIENNKFVFRIINTMDITHINSTQDSGIGLDNLKKRLALLYPNQNTLITEKNMHDNYYLSELIIWI